ncbi:MAG: hypothetical protein ACTSPF_09360 [Candidatus Heimdallarchaeaceae archaeon]
MNELYCPKCGKKHGSANKHCQYCGENLEFIILKLKQKHLPIKYQIETPHLDEEKMQEIEKNISEYEKTEEELDKYDILPENLAKQPVSSSYSQSMQIQPYGKHSSQSQRMKLQRKEEPWWVRYSICCEF